MQMYVYFTRYILATFQDLMLASSLSYMKVPRASLFYCSSSKNKTLFETIFLEHEIVLTHSPSTETRR